MPMVIPLVAAFAAGAGGIAALGAAATIGGIAGTVATVAAYATIAGAVLTGVGAITGSKDLMKIGAVLSIGGGLTGWAAGAAAGAAAGGEAAVSGMDLAADGAASAGNTVGEAAAAIDAPIASPVSSPTTTPTGTAPPEVAGGDPNALTNAYRTEQTTLQPTIEPTKASTVTDPTGGDYGLATGRGAPGTTETVTAGKLDPTSAALKRVSDGAQGITGEDVSSWWEKAKAAGGSVAKFMQDNPGLLKVGGEMLTSMYGPQAEKLDWEKSIYNRARANLNAPIPLTYKRG